jgi:hypothetical protein
LSPDIAVSLVEADAVGGAVVDAVAALEPAVDDVGDDAVAGDTFDGLVRRRGVHWPVMAAWQEGLGDCCVIQNQTAVLKETAGSTATRSGSSSRSAPMACPAGRSCSCS